MVPYSLAEDVCYCEIDDGAVFLDLKRAKYFGLQLAALRMIKPFVDGLRTETETPAKLSRSEIDSEARAAAEVLVERGMLTKGESGTSCRTIAAPIARDAVEIEWSLDGVRRIPPLHWYRFTHACAMTKIRLRWHPLATIVQDLRARRIPDRAQRNDVAELRSLVLTFRRMTPFAFTLKDACLFDSLALLNFLERCGYYPTWILGVATRPFGAHSWLQAGSLVLNDSLENIRRYTPIFTLQ
jgi:hypothetical protein